MDVEVLFEELPRGTLELRMSRSSPGRYALHEFAKNVFDVRVTDFAGMPLPTTRPDLHQWNVTGHQGSVRVAYRIFGDRVDGTYLAVDSTHAHINMPAALMWARGLDERPITIRFNAPAGAAWRVGTQLMPTADPYTYTAPNFHYLMDSPTEFSAFSLRAFTVPDGARAPVFRLAVHHTGTEAELDEFARDVERIVREARQIYGEYPAFENNTYTFIADYLPWANGDGMEHRNSTVLTSPTSIRSNRPGLLDTVSHEFFHVWNAERIRPRSLEPFNFEDANVSGDLWLVEGFTQYYGPLVLLRAGLIPVGAFLEELGSVVSVLHTSPGRLLRSAEEMSRLAPFVDAAASIDRTSFSNTFVSYYTWGAAIAAGLDLTLRQRTDGKVTLDHYMRALWERHGKQIGGPIGSVDRPYAVADLRETLASVSSDARFADEFFASFIEGRQIVDYGRLLESAGLILRPVAPGAGFAGDLRLQDVQGRPRLAAAVPFGSPAYEAGLERDDVILAIGGVEMDSAVTLEQAIAARKPGDEVPVVYERRGQRVTATLRLTSNPGVEIVRAETAGRLLTEKQRAFREAWLSSATRNTF
jgi:predicted metalloprotease with PDZ domain